MPVGDMQDEGGLLFLWVTGRAMELGRECLAAWGSVYLSPLLSGRVTEHRGLRNRYERIDELVWIKTNQLQGLIRTGTLLFRVFSAYANLASTHRSNGSLAESLEGSESTANTLSSLVCLLTRPFPSSIALSLFVALIPQNLLHSRNGSTKVSTLKFSSQKYDKLLANPTNSTT